MKLKTLNNCPVSVSPDGSLNQTKGIIYYPNHPKYPKEQLLFEFIRDKIVDIYQIQRRRDGILEYASIYILAFDSCQLSDKVHIGWTACSVREYVPRPRRCAMFHGMKMCRTRDGICYNCSKPTHDLPCTRPRKCSN